jgi:hypothetical protein
MGEIIITNISKEKLLNTYKKNKLDKDKAYMVFVQKKEIPQTKIQERIENAVTNYVGFLRKDIFYQINRESTKSKSEDYLDAHIEDMVFEQDKRINKKIASAHVPKNIGYEQSSNDYLLNSSWAPVKRKK